LKLLIVEDHGVVREGVTRLLAMHFPATVLEASNIEAALAIHEREQPDVILLDLNLEGAGGLEMLRRLKAEGSSAKVIVFSMHSDPVYALRAMRSGARGYVSKSAPVDELVAAVRQVSSGGQYIDRDLASRMAISQVTAEDPLKSLSIREVEILRLLGQGKSLNDIADALGIAYKTVANICTQMKVKLGVDRTADLIRLAVEMLRA
jgi:DNA-binding NarL/FixJ family response regulator